jgi:hypothetical protein
MAGRDIADSMGSFLGGSSSNKNFVVGNAQTVGPFPVGGRQVTIQFSPRPGYISGTLPTLASIVVQGSLDKKNWYPITGPTINDLGIWTFDCLVPWIRIVGNFGAAEGTVYVYSIR